MPDLESLGLSEDMAPQVDWDAPPPGMTPPSVYPGEFTFLFRMPEDHSEWYDKIKRNVVKDKPETARDFLEITYVPDVVADSQGRPLAAEDGSPLRLGPQTANTFLNANMRIHSLGELLRAMGVRIEGSILSQIDGVLKQLDGHATFKAEVIWRAYFKSTDTTVSTHPRGKKSGELLWPRDAQGQWELMATNPQTGEKAYGYAQIARVKIPTSASSSADGTSMAATG